MAKLGIITKSQKELYHVIADDKEYLCKARGVFRERNIKPLVGDKVEIQILDDKTAYIEKVFERSNFLIRPPVTNIDQILLVHTLREPNINYLNFDKYLLTLEHYDIPVKIIINKMELASNEDINHFKDIYKNTKYDFYFISAIKNIGIEELNNLLSSKISAFAGPSGVGKSTILNLLSENIEADTGSISYKTQRGRHTTRHVELFRLERDTFILDTPGFSALDLSFIDNFRDVKTYFKEFDIYKNNCQFKDCEHINEPKCGIKKAIGEGLISKSRYESYIYIRDEISKERKY